MQTGLPVPLRHDNIYSLVFFFSRNNTWIKIITAAKTLLSVWTDCFSTCTLVHISGPDTLMFSWDCNTAPSTSSCSTFCFANLVCPFLHSVCVSFPRPATSSHLSIYLLFVGEISYTVIVNCHPIQNSSTLLLFKSSLKTRLFMIAFCQRDFCSLQPHPMWNVPPECFSSLERECGGRRDGGGKRRERENVWEWGWGAQREMGAGKGERERYMCVYVLA